MSTVMSEKSALANGKDIKQTNTVNLFQAEIKIRNPEK